MLVKHYRIQAIREELKAHLAEVRQPASWDVVAPSLESAWRKFCRQHFDVLLPNPADYDICLRSAKEG